ncbi:hypothetical protein AAT19DRAFT_13749 [Rhodotorula toruloides]|uniref:Uncharacterized protein n=1 Tax=Rhodotorula toruloides TaxID=5286 RepID=A0A2T0ACF1_RHOTO|nr:hypothetical protein AAT19DRAFT_13749 [Rhodotorula toruloides]
MAAAGAASSGGTSSRLRGARAATRGSAHTSDAGRTKTGCHPTPRPSRVARRSWSAAPALLKRLMQDCEGADGELAVHEQAVKSAESRLDALSRDRWAQYLSAKAADREVDSASAVLATARARLSTVQRRIELERTIRENNYKNLVPANFDTHRTHLLGGRQSI